MLTERDALIGWSWVIEPGDSFSGMLREVFGPVDSFELAKKGSAKVLIDALTMNGFVDQASSRFGDLQKVVRDSLERWGTRLQAVSKFSYSDSPKLNVICPSDELWPEQLSDLGWAAPALLWLDGDPDRLGHLSNSVAFVGSRSNSSYGEWVTAELVNAVGQRGFAVLSGGAYGIDGVAHRAALALEIPTAAVLAGGVDRLYPAGHSALLKEISAKGLLISELPPGSTPTKWRFLQRNRLIAAISQATVVVEAGWRSGSINTANHATNLGRPVGAVPGSITSPNSAGCHRLIREQVAQLISSGEDVLELLGLSNYLFAPETSSLGALETRALDALSARGLSTEQVASKAGLTMSEVSLALTSLEINGLAISAYGKWSRTGSNL